MIYYSGNEFIIRDMKESDVSLIVFAEIAQKHECPDSELYLDRIEEQSKGKNFALVAEYNGVAKELKGLILGHVFVYPYSHSGPFDGKWYTEIVGLKVFEQYQDLGVEDKLMDIAEKIGINFSSTVCLGVKINDIKSLNKYLKRGFSPDESGVWYKNEICHNFSACKNNDDLVLWLHRRLVMNDVRKLMVLSTPEHPSIKWWADGTKKVYVQVNIGKWKDLNVDDSVILEDAFNNEYVNGKVVFKREYDSYENLFKFEGVKNIFPYLDNDDIENAVRFFKGFPGSELVKSYGCIAFGVEVSDEGILR